MAEMLSRFTDFGLSEFLKWIRSGAHGPIPKHLLWHADCSTPISESISIQTSSFQDRFAFGKALVELLKPLDHQSISFDRHLWSWLAAFFFEQVCPRDERGERNLRKEYVYVLSETRVYYRHLVRAPWYLVSTHGDACKYLLVSRSGDTAPLSRQSYLLDQLAARQFVISSPTLIAAAGRLYSDRNTGQPTRGAGAKGSGSPRRLALIANQLALTYDIHTMPTDRFLKLLPEEFGSRRR